MSEINRNEKYIRYSAFSAFERICYYDQIYIFLKRLVIEYPGFFAWYKGLFRDNKELQDGREIIICEKDYRIAGVVILKSVGAENKICTLRVARAFQRQGIGRRLMELSFEWFRDDKPLMTMHKSKQHQFAALLNHYGFVLEQEQWSYYHVFSTELSYNGILPPKKIFFNQFEIRDINLWCRNFISSGKYNIKDFMDECIGKWYLREQCRTMQIMNA